MLKIYTLSSSPACQVIQSLKLHINCTCQSALSCFGATQCSSLYVLSLFSFLPGLAAFMAPFLPLVSYYLLGARTRCLNLEWHLLEVHLFINYFFQVCRKSSWWLCMSAFTQIYWVPVLPLCSVVCSWEMTEIYV